MLSKCANPECATTLHYLREGKVFKVEADELRAIDAPKPVRRVEHFWLCGPCSTSLTLIYDRAAGVRIIQKPAIARRAIA